MFVVAVDIAVALVFPVNGARTTFAAATPIRLHWESARGTQALPQAPLMPQGPKSRDRPTNAKKVKMGAAIAGGPFATAVAGPGRWRRNRPDQ